MLKDQMTNKTVMVTLLAAVPLACFLTIASAQGQKGKPVLPTQTWQGQMKDAALMKAAPANNFVANAKDWEALWKAWRGDEKIPAVDFQKELVIVVKVGGPNNCGIVATLEENGNLRVQTQTTLLDGPGFGYQLGTVPRAGLKTINGKDVPAFGS